MWTAQFKDGSVVNSSDLIYPQIKDRLDDLILLSFVQGRDVYNLLWQEGVFIVNAVRFVLHDKSKLENIRPICFFRESVPFATQGVPCIPTIVAVGLGFQGNVTNGDNKKCLILIYPDGKFCVEM